MAIADTKVYYVTAAGTTPEDYINALQAHFASAPGLWENKPGVITVAGQGLVIKRKLAAEYTHDVAIRRVGTTNIHVATDPDKAITDTGSPSVAITGSANMTPEGEMGTQAFSGVSPQLLIIECSTAIFIVWQDSAKTAFPYGIHAGDVYKPQHDNDATFGMDGTGNLTGKMSTSGSPAWSTTINPANGARVRLFDLGGNAQYGQPLFYPLPFASSADNHASFPDGGRASPRKPLIRGYIASGRHTNLGFAKYIAHRPGNSAAVGAVNPKRVFEGPNEAWIVSRDTQSTAGGLIPWEKGAIPQ